MAEATSAKVAETKTPPTGRIKVLPPAPAHPDAPMDDDFIAKALAETAVEDAPRVAANETLKAERPRGIMSLGGWW